MSYIDKNANLLLLFLIALIAVSLVGATIFFQDRFATTNDEYALKKAELENVTAELEKQKAVLSKAKEELQLKLSREEEFTQKFTEVKSDKDTLEADLRATANALNVKTAELSQEKTKTNQLTSQVSALQAKVDSLRSDVSNLQDKVDCLKSTADGSENTC